MKLVIFPVWAHLGRDRHVEYDRLARSFSVGDGTILGEHAVVADRLQKDYDDAAEPVRVYVYEITHDKNFVPVYAGGQLVPLPPVARRSSRHNAVAR